MCHRESDPPERRFAMPALSRRKFLTLSGAAAAWAASGRFAAGEEPKVKPADTPAEGSRLAAGNTRFGFDLYGKLREAPGNVFLSPFSISAALAMTAAGAKGATLAEMKQTLHLPDGSDAGFAAILKSFAEAPPMPGEQPKGFQLSVVNALWAQQGYPWKDDYRKLVIANYAAGLNDVDFKSNPDASRRQINAWVEKATKEKIKDLLPPEAVTIMTRLVLTNAIYFRADWFSKFTKDATKDQPFFLADGSKIDAPLMHRTGGYLYGEKDGYQIADLPYVGRGVSMTIVLPKKPDGLAAVEKELTAEKLAEAIKNMTYERQVELYLPRFKVEKTYSLKE